MTMDRGDDQAVILATASTMQEALRWRQALDEERVRCQVVDEFLGRADVVPPGTPVPEVWVCRRDLERAKRILDEYRQARTTAGGGA
jgi:hypothetical protein